MAEDIQEARRALESWHIGQTSARYESRGRGAGVISSGKGDHGGVSYGAHQLSSKKGTLKEYLDQSPYGKHFDGLVPATPEFDAKWRGLAKADPGFAKDQHDFIGRSHYGEQRSALKERGLNLDGRGRAVQDALWSTSVQFRNLTPAIFAKGLAEKFGNNCDLSKLSDRDIVEAVQDYKIEHNASLFKSSPEWQPGLLKRANSEKAALERLAMHEELLERNGIDITHRARAVAGTEAHARTSEHPVTNVLKSGDRSEDVRHLQVKLTELGYKDANGRPIALDGDFGLHTKEAVRAFQRAHGLMSDGVVGDDTRLELARSQRTPLLSERTHPDNSMYQQARNGLKELHGAGFRSEVELDRVAAAVAFGAKQAGLKHIDHVIMNTRGDGLIAVQGNLQDPGRHVVSIDKTNAVTQSLEESTARLAQQSARDQQSSQAQVRAEHMEHRGGLVLGIRQ